MLGLIAALRICNGELITIFKEQYRAEVPADLQGYWRDLQGQHREVEGDIEDLRQFCECESDEELKNEAAIVKRLCKAVKVTLKALDAPSSKEKIFYRIWVGLILDKLKLSLTDESCHAYLGFVESASDIRDCFDEMTRVRENQAVAEECKNAIFCHYSAWEFICGLNKGEEGRPNEEDFELLLVIADQCFSETEYMDAVASALEGLEGVEPPVLPMARAAGIIGGSAGPGTSDVSVEASC